MIMVVFSHVLLFSFRRQSVPGFNDLFSLIMLPLFFFISGFLTRQRFKDKGGGSACFRFILKKFLALAVPTVIFQLVYSMVIGGGELLWIDKAKQGFWFTYTLFYFFLVYAMGDFLLSKILKDKVLVWAGAIGAIACYAFAKFSLSPACPWSGTWIANVLGFANFQFFIFFFLGVVLGQSQDRFFRLLDNGKWMAVFVSLFAVLFLTIESPNAREFIFSHGGMASFSLLKTVICLLAVVVAFAFFRKYASSMSKGTFVGKLLQPVGVFSLDVYLIHLFFIRGELDMLGDWFAQHNNPILELVAGLAIAFVIIGICLLISKVLRCSDVLAKVLFGKVTES